MRKIENIKILVPVKRNSIGNHIFYLNDVGAFIWESASSFMNVDDLVSEVARIFNVDNDIEAIDSIRNFTNGLIEIGLLDIKE
jgi:hypothetical protein